MSPLHTFRTAALATAIIVTLPTAAFAQSSQDLILDALSAAPESIALDATVMDWEQNVLQKGASGWVCFPSPPDIANAPMCMDEAWQTWAHAWMSKGPVTIDRVGVAYMLQGDGGASNTDPFAKGPTADNAWVVEGPHLMLIVPDPADLDALSTDPENGGPYVMWKGTPYAHIMVPVN